MTDLIPDSLGVQAPADDLGLETFLTWLVRDVAGTLQEVVGLEEAKGYLSLVGDQMGSRLDQQYQGQHGPGPWSIETLSEVLVDLKRQISGDFTVTELTEDRISFSNTRCPFGDAVLDRPSLCMMTSNVFGRIASNHLGHVSVDLAETIARGDGRCVVHLALRPEVQVEIGNRRHYFADV